MDREILFRGKRLDGGAWVEGNLLTSAAYPSRAWITESKTFFDKILGSVAFVEVAPATVGQYTGLTDANGEKIFENDIVRYDDELWTVEWDENDLMFQIFSLDGCCYVVPLCEIYGTSMEIVGYADDDGEGET